MYVRLLIFEHVMQSFMIQLYFKNESEYIEIIIYKYFFLTICTCMHTFIHMPNFITDRALKKS